MNQPFESNTEFILNALSTTFKKEIIQRDALFDFVQKNKPDVLNNLYPLLEFLEGKQFIKHIAGAGIDEYKITPPGIDFLSEMKEKRQKEQLLIDTANKSLTTSIESLRITKINTNWVIIAAIAAIFGVLLTIYFNGCQNPHS